MKNYVHIDPPTFNEDQAFIDAIYFTLSRMLTKPKKYIAKQKYTINITDTRR